MKALELIADALPKRKGVDHYKNLQDAFIKSQWHGVHLYVENVTDFEKQNKFFNFGLRK